MYGNDDQNSTKLRSLMDLIQTMKGLHGSSASPKGMAIEVHEAHAEPLSHDDVEQLEEATHTDLDNDNEEGESPEHKAMVMGSDHDNSDEEYEDDESPEPMQLPEGLMKLLAEKMHK